MRCLSQICVCAAADVRFAYAIPVYGCGYNCTEPDGLLDHLNLIDYRGLVSSTPLQEAL